MNNRNPFIPNIPTAQGGWGDPHQIYSQTQSFNCGNISNSSGGGSGSSGNQTSVQIPFSAHQQVQQQLQGSHGQWYTTQTGASIPLTTLPLQGTTGSIFWDDGSSSSVNLNTGVNYTTYQNQNTNSGGYQQQQQQVISTQQSSPAAVVHQIVTQQQRVVPLSLDASHFVHFPVNLSSASGMTLSLNSRSSNSSSPGCMSPVHGRSSELVINSRNLSTPMSMNSPSPTSMIEPLQLNARANTGNTTTNFNSNNNSRSNVSSSMHNVHSQFSNNSNNSNSNMNSSSSSSRLIHQQNNSRITANHFVTNNSPSPPAHHVSTPVSRNSRSPAAYSGNSPSHSHSPSPSPAQINSRGTSSGAIHNNNANHSFNSNKSQQHHHQTDSASSNSGLTLNPPTYSPGFPSSLNARFSPAAVQFLTTAAAASMNLTEATLRQQLALNAAASLSAQNFLANANNNLRLQQQQNQQQQHQIAPVTHSRASVPVTPLPFHTRIVEESDSPSASPSPPPPPPKRKRGPPKKRAPKKPVAINPMELSNIRPNPNFQPQNLNPLRHPAPQQPINRPSVISSTPQSSNPTHTPAWNSQPQVSSIPLPTINPFPLVPTPLPGMQRMTRPPQPPVNKVSMSTPTKVLNMPSLGMGSPVITTSNTSPRMGNPMLSSTAELSPVKSTSNFSSPNKSPNKSNSKFTSVLDYAMERAGIGSDPAGLQEDIDNSDVFREDEIMKLVGQIPDQTNDLHMLNPVNELRSSEKGKTDVASWEQEALKSASQSGLDDLQFELDRFYCPPSPPKAVAADPNAMSSLPASESNLTTIGGVLSTTQPVLPAKKPVASDSSASAQPAAPQTTPVDLKSPEKSSATGTNKKIDSDDDCEVILVKLTTKKRRLVRRVVNPKQMQAGKAALPKTGPGGTGSRPVPSRAQTPATANRPGRSIGSEAASNRNVPTPPKPRQDRQPPKRVTRSHPNQETAKIPMRPALTNGRVNATTPKVTSSISSHNDVSVNKIQSTLKSQLSQGQNVQRVPIKKTGGDAVAVPKIVKVEGGLVISSSSTSIKSKPTARKSTAPLPKHLKEPSKELNLSPLSTQSKSTRGNAHKMRDTSFDDVPSKMISGRPKKGRQVEDDEYLQILSAPSFSMPPDEDRPPIKMTLSLSNSKVVNRSSSITKNSKRGKSKKSPRGSKSTKRTKAKKKSESPKYMSLPSPLHLEDSEVSEGAETRKRAGLRPKSSTKKLLDGSESEEDLQILEEYLADSDDSFDPEGEKDEASSESESEPEPEDDEEIVAFKKIVNVVEPETVAEKKPETESAMEVTDKAPVSPENIPSPSRSTPEPSNLDDGFDSHDSPVHHDFGVDSPPPAAEDNADMDVEPEPGPFTNLHSTGPDSGPEKSTEEGWSAVLEDAGEPEPPNPASNAVVEEKTAESSESEDDEVTVEEVPQPKVFEMPKPQVIIKGTKEDADKAVTDMRNALAQLSKFKIPFFGK